jgi:hypothetical protein
MSSKIRRAAEQAITAAVAAQVAADHMTPNTPPREPTPEFDGQSVPVALSRVADIMAALPIGPVFTREAEVDAQAQIEGFCEAFDAVPTRAPEGDGSTYTWNLKSDSTTKVLPDDTGKLLKDCASAFVTFAFKQAKRAARDFAQYEAREKAEIEARSNTAAGPDDDRLQTALGYAEQRAVESIHAASVALIQARAMSAWSARKTDGIAAVGREWVPNERKPAAGARGPVRATGILRSR